MTASTLVSIVMVALSNLSPSTQGVHHYAVACPTFLFLWYVGTVCAQSYNNLQWSTLLTAAAMWYALSPDNVPFQFLPLAYLP